MRIRPLLCLALAATAVAAALPATATAAGPARALVVAVHSKYLPALDLYSGPRRVAQVEMTIPQGAGLIFKNLDSEEHNITSGVQDPDGLWYPTGLFRTEWVDRQDDAVVVGGAQPPETLAPGRYPFYCEVHNGIPSGVLVIVPT